MISSGVSETPYLVGSAPVFTITPIINALQLTYNQSAGGIPDASSYYYSIDGTETTIGVFSSPYTIEGLNTNVSRSIYMGVRGYDGENTLIWDASSLTQTATPYIKGEEPTLTIDSSTNSLVLNIGQSTGGNPIDSEYYYSIDGSFVSIGSYVSKYTITGLTTNEIRSIYVGARGYDESSVIVWDASSTTQTAKPYVVGTTPSITSVTSYPNRLTVAFIGSTGANPEPTYYYSYSADGSDRVGPVTSPFDISGITNTQTIYIVATNIVGDLISIGVTETPYILGSKPTIDSIISGTNQLTVYFSQSLLGTAPTTYYYSFDGTTKIGSCISPFVISELTNTSTYSVYIIADNSAGLIVSDASNGYVFGTAPTINSIVSSLNQLTVYFTQSQVGTSPTTYYYSIDGTTKLGSGTTTSPLIISGISSSTTFYIIANNAGGDIVSASTGTGIPYIAGSAPSSVSLTAVDGSENALDVSFAGSSGGYPNLTKYQYSLNGGTFQDAIGTTSPIRIIGLTAGISYTVALKAVSGTEWTSSSSTTSSSVSTNKKGSAPIINAITGRPNGLSVDFTGSTGGTPSPSTYYYSLNGGNYIDAKTTNSPLLINKLNTVGPYLVKIVSVNSAGNSPASNEVSGTPIIGSDVQITPATYWTQSTSFFVKASFWKKSYWLKRKKDSL